MKMVLITDPYSQYFGRLAEILEELPNGMLKVRVWQGKMVLTIHRKGTYPADKIFCF
jgi:hypothetical protein